MSSRYPATSTTTGTTGVGKLSQQTAALKLKAISQLRQVLRSSPNRGAMAFALGKDLLIVLRYLPVGIMNKVQQITGVGGNEVSRNSSSISDNTTSSSGPSSDKDPKDKSYLKSTQPTPSPTKHIPHPLLSVLKNVLEINSQNNRVIDAKRKIVAVNPNTAAGLDDISPEEVPDPEEPAKTVARKIIQRKIEDPPEFSKFLETNLFWQNIESRTKYLVLAIQKCLSSTSTSHTHNLSTHLDDLFSHIYQHHETRNTAIANGGVKILSKVIKTHQLDSYVVHRAREILGLLGINPPTKGKGIKILSIDGGGVRGLVALEVLRSVERITGKRICDLFDYICGVSTGSILAFLIGAHRKSLDEAEQLYKDLSKEIFSQNSFFGNAGLLWSHSFYHTPTFEKILKKHCGEKPLIYLARDPDLPRVSAISCVVNQERVSPYVFRTYTFPPTTRPTHLGGCRYHMWEAVRASAAAPTYFEEFKLGNYLHQDGGILVNNPTSVAISEAKSIWKSVPIQCVISVGTGLTLSSRTDKNLNDLIEQGKEGLNFLSWKGKFLKVLDSATDTESVHNTLNELIPHDIYFRFNPYLSDVVRLDESNPVKLEAVQLETRSYLERNVEKVKFACKTLTKEKGFSKKVTDWWYHP